MTDLIPYATPPGDSYDAGQLRVLSILHYVWGSLAILISFIFLFYIVIGLVMVNSAGSFNAPASSRSNVVLPPVTTTSGVIVTTTTRNAPPAAFGYIFALMGGCGLLMGWAFGILTIISGRRMAQYRSRTFSMVMAGINCISFPFGTALGIFTIIVLSRESVRAMYVD